MKDSKRPPVFAVSNLHYAALKGSRAVSGARLSVSDTGIPALRDFILQSAAPFQLQAVEDLVNHKFTVFMKGLSMWAKSYAVESRTAEELLLEIKKPAEEVGTVIEEYLEDIKSSAQKIIVERLEHSQEDSVSTALEQLQIKKKWVWATLRAFIRRQGNHKTSVAPKQSWNEQFQSTATEQVLEFWDSFIEEENIKSEKLKGGLTKLIKRVSDCVNNHPAGMVLPTDRIDEILDAQAQGIEQACRDHQDAVAKDLR